jgi:hypothetical protein
MNRITQLSSVLLVATACGGMETTGSLAERDAGQPNVDSAAGDAEDAALSKDGAYRPWCLTSVPQCAGRTLDGGCLHTWSQVLDISSWCTSDYVAFDSVGVGCGYGTVSNASTDTANTCYFELSSGALVGWEHYDVNFGDSDGCTVGLLPEGGIEHCPDVSWVIVTSCDAGIPAEWTSSRDQ